MSELSSGKDHSQENFPVASWLLKRKHRAPIMAFYRFARAADDIADHPAAPPEEKLDRLAQMRAGLTGQGAPEAMALAAAASIWSMRTICWVPSRRMSQSIAMPTGRR